MKNFLIISSVFLLAVLLSSCAAIAGVFKAGVWVGVVIVILVILLIVYIASRGSRK